MVHFYNVHCMLCGRASGQVRNGSFRRLSGAPPLKVQGGKSRCGYCGGTLYLEAEDSPFARDLGTFASAGATAATAKRRAS